LLGGQLNARQQGEDDAGEGATLLPAANGDVMMSCDSRSSCAVMQLRVVRGVGNWVIVLLLICGSGGGIFIGSLGPMF
jgi:hypothetical protein